MAWGAACVTGGRGGAGRGGAGQFLRHVMVVRHGYLFRFDSKVPLQKKQGEEEAAASGSDTGWLSQQCVWHSMVQCRSRQDGTGQAKT
jgi:hypothetical protein